MARKIEIATGTINGVNTSFSTSAPYVAGSLSVWRNGQEILMSFSETDPSAGTFEITDPDQVPISGIWGSDRLVVEYWDGIEDSEIVQVDEIAVTISDVPVGIDCQVHDVTVIECRIEDVPVGLNATVEDVIVVACDVSDAPVGVDCQVEDC